MTKKRNTVIGIIVTAFGIAGCLFMFNKDWFRRVVSLNAPSPAPAVTVTILSEGHGARAVRGNVVTVHYSARLANGAKVDNTKDRNAPLTFTLGLNQVIRGLDDGIAGMRPGERRKLEIPSPLAYGAGGAGNLVPPNSALTYEVELVEIR